MKNISGRRRLITAILLTLALTGGVIRVFAPQPSLLRDFGTLLLVLWLPIIGNIIAWSVARWHARKPAPPGFDTASPFEPSARIELTLLAAAVPAASRPIPPGLFPCVLAVGNTGFTARLRVPADAVPEPEVPAVLDVQLLRPDLALATLSAGAEFVLIAGRTTLGRGVVLGSSGSIREADLEKSDRALKDRMAFLSGALSACHLKANEAMDASSGDGLA
ncbi:MAG: hypothetical protein V4757_03315 [Pseudomonadota bacterium]